MLSAMFTRAAHAIFGLGMALASAHAQADLRVVSQGKATQIETDEYLVHSDAIGRDFLIEVARPAMPRQGGKMPVVYITDGGFSLAGPMIHLLGEARRIPPTFAVSIGYPNEKGRYIGPRQTDLVHFKTPAGGGGGAAFEAFLMNDVRLFIESRYPVDPAKSVLVGHSAGGAFTAMVMVRKPESFAGYVIGGLPVSMMGDSLFDSTKTIVTRGGGRRVFIGYSPPDAANLKADTFAAPLSASGSTFNVRQMEFKDDDHNTSYVELIARGIPFVLPTDGSDRTAIPLDPKLLDRYVGVYRVSEKVSFTITRGGDRLFGAGTGGQPTELFAESETTFFTRGLNAQVVFNSEAGKVVSAWVSINNNEALARRID